MEEKLDIDLTMSEPSTPIGRVKPTKRASDLWREPVSGPTGRSSAGRTRFYGRPAETCLVAKQKAPAHDILTDVQELLKSGDLSATALDTMVRKKIDRWVATAIDETSAMATKKRARSSGHFTFRRNKWQILGWKGLALLLPVPVAKIMNDFLVAGILCHDHQYTWTIRTVCEIFRIGQYVALFRFNKAATNHELLGGGESTQNLFLTVEQQRVVFAELDKKLTEDDEYISIMFIIAKAAVAKQLLGKEHAWEKTFSFSGAEFEDRADKLCEDIAALEEIIGSAQDWGVDSVTSEVFPEVPASMAIIEL
ncbi:hypothetical protein B0T11DRAFT_294754 [Plectosphaerella cucumerina]|uniref:Uncharacterized protein n=1 Tax=Plectosphaerella cucumerina TaxID=40658 RepID=A0A8K0X6G6_9PEZI|nr:hypothetical protein B0T11DRAFT_294754 [Plectosphaerella cucumerina]